MSDTDRRDFLKTTAALASAAALPNLLTPQAASAAAPGHGLRKAVKFTMVAGNASVADKFQLLKDLGFEGVDINRHLPHDEVVKAVEKTGLIAHGTVGYDHWKLPLSSPDKDVRKQGIESFIACMKDAKAYGGTSTLLVPGIVNEQIAYGDAYKRTHDAIKHLLDEAEKLEIDILLENVWNNLLLSPVETANYIDSFKSERIGAYFDVGNVVRYGWPEHWVLALGHRIKKLDIKEYSRDLQNSKGPRAGFGVKLGEGSVDWPKVMAALKQIGYTGWATAEVRGGDAERLKDISVRMDRCFGDA